MEAPRDVPSKARVSSGPVQWWSPSPCQLLLLERTDEFFFSIFSSTLVFSESLQHVEVIGKKKKINRPLFKRVTPD